jgi:hypothetical protein
MEINDEGFDFEDTRFLLKKDKGCICFPMKKKIQVWAVGSLLWIVDSYQRDIKRLYQKFDRRVLEILCLSNIFNLMQAPSIVKMTHIEY